MILWRINLVFISSSSPNILPYFSNNFAWYFFWLFGFKWVVKNASTVICCSCVEKPFMDTGVSIHATPCQVVSRPHLIIYIVISTIETLKSSSLHFESKRYLQQEQIWSVTTLHEFSTETIDDRSVTDQLCIVTVLNSRILRCVIRISLSFYLRPTIRVDNKL